MWPGRNLRLKIDDTVREVVNSDRTGGFYKAIDLSLRSVPDKDPLRRDRRAGLLRAGLFVVVTRLIYGECHGYIWNETMRERRLIKPRLSQNLAFQPVEKAVGYSLLMRQSGRKEEQRTRYESKALLTILPMTWINVVLW